MLFEYILILIFFFYKSGDIKLCLQLVFMTIDNLIKYNNLFFCASLKGYDSVIFEQITLYILIDAGL
jgi:hypothetical protein